MQVFHAPGVAIGLIHQGQVVLAKGFGLRDVQRSLPVTSHTIFAVGSISKSFTAAVAAALVDQGKLEWDRPVREYLPWIRLADPVATDLITMRDLLTHRSGLPGHNFIRFAVPLQREELMRRLRFLEPNQPFRSTFQYNNLMFAAAGYLEGVLAGSTWEQLVQDRIFTPLAMRSSNTSALDSQKSPDYAKPYERQNGTAREIPFYIYQTFGVGPNGAVNSTVDDLLQYLQFQMGDGAGILSTARMREMHQPQMIAPPQHFDEVDLVTYGLGWYVESYRGRKLVQHGGAINGFRAWTGFLPRERDGVVVLSNLGSSLPEALSFTLLDRLLGIAPADWIGRLSAAPSSQPKIPAPRPDAPPSHKMAEYAGTYSHPAYGKLIVETRGDGLQLVFPAQSIPAKHYHYDVFQAENGWLIEFRNSVRGEIESVAVPVEPAVKPTVFRRFH